MELKHTRHSRRAKKPRPRRLLVGIFAIVLVLFGSYVTTSFSRESSKPLATTISSQSPLAKDAQLAWPMVGQAAIGSVKDGLLAHSSDNEEPRPTASMAKIITALAIMEKQPFEPGQTGRSYTLTAKDVANYHIEAARDGSVVAVHEGMVLTQYQAMQAMLIASGNNVADTLVERIFGSEEAYVSYAQNMLQRMGLSQTVVADASGFNPATVSTPSELVIIGITALKNPVIAEIVAQSQAWIPGIGIIQNTNELLGIDGVSGIKTGTTDKAGSCLLFAAGYTAKNGQKTTIVGVVMGSIDASGLYSDSRKLLTSTAQGLGLIETQSIDNTAPPSGRMNQ
jgi:D-alanyl-D-alanine carboxypeptidase (penicillin-binding protein 5/6)